ncbi:MAG: rhodanese-like domain-containing protein [Kineosporiaceae bacterium]|jgi:thioredoxin 1
MERTMEVGLQEFQEAHREGAYVIDVRQPDEYVAAHIPEVRLVPLNSLAGAFSTLPENTPIYIVCATGARSLHATLALRRAGVEAYSLAGGTMGWIRAGLPVKSGAPVA